MHEANRKTGAAPWAVAMLVAAWTFAGWQATANAAPSEGAPSEGQSAPPTALLAPPSGDRPVVVTIRFRVHDLNDIDDAEERFEFDGTLELEWHDARRAFDPAEIGVDEQVYQGAFQFHEIATGWYPQVILRNESGRYDVDEVVLRIAADGACRLVQKVDAAAEADLKLRRYPFDEQRLEARFEVLDGGDGEVRLQTDQAPLAKEEHGVVIPQWDIQTISATTESREPGGSSFVLSIDAKRSSFFVVRLVVLPLLLIVVLSWSVFWMEGSSLGDRIGVSFIGILTAVAYQIVVSEIQPHIAYMTLMHGFLNLSLLLMCATVVVNLLVGAFERRGDPARARAIDHRCRWVFPAIYLGLNGLMAAIAFVFF